MTTCPRCRQAALVQGVALKQTWVPGLPDFLGAFPVYNMDGQTLVVGGPGKLVTCLKCPSCGHSIFAGIEDFQIKKSDDAAKKVLPD